MEKFFKFICDFSIVSTIIITYLAYKDSDNSRDEHCS